MNLPADNELMLRVKEGDLYPMGLLFKRYHRELFGFFYHMSGNPDASEDMVQTAFYRMIKYKNSFTGHGAFRSWMYQLARNVLLDHVEKNKQSARQHNVEDYAERIGGGMLADELLQKYPASESCPSFSNTVPFLWVLNISRSIIACFSSSESSMYLDR